MSEDNGWRRNKYGGWFNINDAVNIEYDKKKQEDFEKNKDRLKQLRGGKGGTSGMAETVTEINKLEKWFKENGYEDWLKKEKEDLKAANAKALGLEDTSYQSNKAPETGIFAHDMIKNIKKIAPNDLEKPEMSVLKKIADNPNAEVTVYRATTGNGINNGDWVFLDEEKAKKWTKTAMGSPKPGFKVVSMKVKASNLEWANKNLEFAYRKK